MGIDGLLKMLNQITVKQHISSFRGLTVAIDMMPWIYKGCYRCAFELNQNIESNNFLYYIIQMLDLLLYYNIKPICVFDGRYVGNKNQTIQKRKKSKEEDKQRGLDYLKIGNEEEARKYLSRCIFVDDRIITTVMSALLKKKIQYMVAPFESDSQIAKIIQLRLADFAISQDSDLVIYGMKVVMKLAQDGQCDYVDLSKWRSEDVDDVFIKEFLQMDHVNRVQSAILAGSDYNDSIKGIGIKKAVKNLSKMKDMNSVIKYFRQLKAFSDKVPENYEKIVLESKLIFLLATVYNPLTKQLQYLNPERLTELLPKGMSQEDLRKIVGPRYNFTEQVSLGKVNPRNLQKREIIQIQLKSTFSINPDHLAIKENNNKERRINQIIRKKQREQNLKIMAQNGQLDSNGNIKKITKSKKSTQNNSGPQLTVEQKKKLSIQRKQEKHKNFMVFKGLLKNTIFNEIKFETNEINCSFQSDEEMEEEVNNSSSPQNKPSQEQIQASSKKSTLTNNNEEQSMGDESSMEQSDQLLLLALKP